MVNLCINSEDTNAVPMLLCTGRSSGVGLTAVAVQAHFALSLLFLPLTWHFTLFRSIEYLSCHEWRKRRMMAASNRSTVTGARGEDLEPFCHTPLQETGTYIRLLKAEFLQDGLQSFTISTWPIEQAPEYNAISYT